MPRTQRSRRFVISYADWGGGLQEFTSPLWVNDTESPFLENIDNQKPGVLSKSLGYVREGSGTATGAVNGLGVFSVEDGSDTLLRAFSTSIDQRSGTGTGASWVSVYSGLATGADKVEFINGYFDDEERVYFTSGLSNNLAYWNGTSTGVVTGVKAKHIDLYRNKLFMGNVSVSVVTGTGTGTGYGTETHPVRVQWTSEGTDVLDVENDFFDDMGQAITAVKTFADKLYVFSEDKVATYDEFSLRTLPGNYGTTSARSVKIIDQALIWYNRGGVYMYGGAGSPQLISRKVQGWIDAIVDPEAVGAGVDKYGRYNLYIGDVTYDGTSYEDVVLIYDPKMNCWLKESSRPFGVWSRVRNGGSFEVYAGSVNSESVFKVHSGYGNNGSGIASEWVTAKFDLGKPDDLKNFYTVYATYEPQNTNEYLTIKYRLDGDTAWSQIEGTSNNVPLSGTGDIAVKKLALKNAQGKFIQLQVTHTSSANSFKLYKLELEADTYSSQ